MSRLAVATAIASVAGCGPPTVFLPNAVLPWWLVVIIIGGFALSVYLRSGRKP